VKKLNDDVLERFSSHAKVLEEFMNVLRELTSPAERRLLMLSASENLNRIKWWGIPLLTERLLEDLRKEHEDGIILSLICRFLIKKDKDYAVQIAEELLDRIEELSEWEYDRAMSLYTVAFAMYDAGEESLAKKYIMEALKWAKRIPDRSDRSISLSNIVPLLYKLGEKKLALSLIDDIVYEPKKIDAIINLAASMDENDEENLKILLAKSPKDIRPHVLVTYASVISPKNPPKVLGFVKKALSVIGSSDNIQAIHVKLKAYDATVKIKDDRIRRFSAQLLDDLIKSLLGRIDDRPYLNALFQLLEVASQYDKETVISTLNKLESEVDHKKPPENLYMLNRIGYIYSKLGELSKAANAIGLSIELAKDVDKIVAIPSIIDAGTILLKIMNEFPEDIPRDLVESYIELIKPTEYVEISIKLSTESFEFLRRMYPGINLNDLINSMINKERIYNMLQIEDKVKYIIYSLIDRDEYIIVHYILKYIYSIGLNENERLSILNILGRVTELLTSGAKDMAKTYLDLIFNRLNRLNLPITPILIEYMREYFLTTSLSELL